MYISVHTGSVHAYILYNGKVCTHIQYSGSILQGLKLAIFAIGVKCSPFNRHRANFQHNGTIFFHEIYLLYGIYLLYMHIHTYVHAHACTVVWFKVVPSGLL